MIAVIAPTYLYTSTRKRDFSELYVESLFAEIHSVRLDITLADNCTLIKNKQQTSQIETKFEVNLFVALFNTVHLYEIHLT